ncbi:hypothetical protein [Dyadobacter sp. BHUBP1]|uniref:hypothetical protein n=1 Tax=Dyadobacter sp. BHUBP1 TaxID=3424178 RepID=UPI003D32C3A8
MKQITLTFLVTYLLCGSVHSQQSKAPKEVTDLQALLAQANPDKHPAVQLMAGNQVLQIDEYLIPLAETTLVRCEKDGGKYQVKFFLQNGTAVTKTSDPAFRHAYWAIELRDKKACEQFVALFEKMIDRRKG